MLTETTMPPQKQIYYCKILVFGYEPCQILGVVEHFSKHCCCHPQSEYVLVGRSWSFCVRQREWAEFDVMELTGVVRAGCYSIGDKNVFKKTRP